MEVATVFLAVLAVGLGAATVITKPDRLGEAMKQMRKQGMSIVFRLPLALLAAAFLSQLVPAPVIGAWIGGASGWQGILLASALGGLLPGGPAVTFPLALVIWQMGAGQPQMIALLAAWSIFAFHRIISFELPMMGPRFVLLRLSSSWMLPPLSGIIAAAIVTALTG